MLQVSLNKEGLFDSIQLSPPSSKAVNHVSLSVISSTTPAVSAVTTGVSYYLMWYNRLGHPNNEAMKAILQLCSIFVPHKSLLDFCSPCCLGKIHRLPSTLSHTIYSQPFELLFVDV